MHGCPMKPKLIAEVKTTSPWSDRKPKSWLKQFEIAAEHGDMISIHTDPRWDGSFALLEVARSMTDKPILAKGFHDDDGHDRALECGATYVLCVADYMGGEFVFYEYAHYLELTDWADGIGTAAIVINARDPFTGNDRDWINASEIERVRRYRQEPIVQASYIKKPEDVWPGVDYILVGTHLEEFVKTW